MKMALFTFAFLIAGSSFAQAEMVAVQDPARVKDYAIALYRAAYATPMDCTDTRGPRVVVSAAIQNLLGSDQAWVDKSGSQPAILLATNVGPRDRSLSRITTSSDYSQILSIRIESQSVKSVNTVPSLIDPVVQEQYVSDMTIDCVRRK